MRDSARVVIIGGGAVGASCLYHLTQAGVNDCVLIEKDELTSGSTWHAAGNIPTYANSWLGMRAGNYAWKLYKELAKDQDSPITYRHTGAFWPAHNRDRMDLFQHLCGVSRSAGYELRMLSPDEMDAMHPYYQSGPSVLGGIYDPYEGDIDPSQLTQALVNHARQKGAEVARFTTVTGIDRTRDNEWLVTTNQGMIRSEVVVNATGFYGHQLGKMIGQNLPVAVLEHQYLVTDSLQELEQNPALFPLVRDPDIRFYLRRERASFLFGSYGHPGRLAFSNGLPDQFAHSLFEDSVDDIVDLLEQAIDHVPLLADASAQRFVNGPIGYTPDGLPLCGPAYGLPNFYHACGIQIGITHSAAVGKAITEWVTTGETEWDYAAWDPRRFGDWANQQYAQERIVELYDLQYAIPFPHRLIQSGRPVQTTPLYERLKKAGAVFGQIGGWERAFWFDLEGDKDTTRLSFRNEEAWRDAVQRECEAVRDAVGVMDHGGFTKYEVTGTGASDFLNRVFCGQLPAQGRVKLSYMLTPQGKIWSEATIARLDDNRYLLCGPTLADWRDHDWLRSAVLANESVDIRRGSDNDGALLVMGPKSRALLSKLCEYDLSRDSMPWMSVAEITVAGVPLLAMRVSYVGELGWELHMPSKHLRTVYEALHTAGEEFGLVNFGSYALNSMRIEKGYHGWGSDFGSEYTLFDADLVRFIDFNKPKFIGQEAVLEQQERTAEWRFVKFIVSSTDADPLPGDPILLSNECVGYVTSGCTGFRVSQCLAMGYVRNDIDAQAVNFDIEILGKRCEATLTHQLFYDPENARLRS